MPPYITNGVLVRLHYQKLGQHHSRQKAMVVVAAISLLAILTVFFTSRPGDTHRVWDISFVGDGVDARPNGLQTSSQPRTMPPMYRPRTSGFPNGYIGKYTIIRDSVAPPTPSLMSREIEKLYPAPEIDGQFDDGVFSLQPTGDGDLPFGWVDGGFGLPDAPPMWRHTLRRLPRGLGDDTMGFPMVCTPPHAKLANPNWPRNVWLVNDTAVVDGYLTLHKYGLISFELVSESHPRLGFADAVQRAIKHSICYPAKDSDGNRISVRCQYRCIFTGDNKPTVTVSKPSLTPQTPYDGSITATVRR